MDKIFEYIKSNDIKGIIDIGANIGMFSHFVRMNFPNINLFMVEANPFCDSMLNRLNIPYKIACLSDSIKEVQFYFEDKNMIGTGASYYLENTEFYSMRNFTKMTTQLLDTIVEENCSDQTFDMFKMDTQGSEIDILKGATNTLKNINHIIMETSLIQYNIGSPLKDDVIAYMETIDFKPVEKVQDHYFNGQLIQEDWIFTRQ